MYLWTITSRDDIEHFILSLESEKWKWKTPPENAAEAGSFHLTQEKTIKYGHGILSDIATITLYDDSCISFEIGGLDMTFTVSEDTADYLNGYFV